MDELLKVLQEQLKTERYVLLHDKRVEAYKFLNSAYNYVDCRDCVEEAFDQWEQDLLFGLNFAVGLSRKSSREQLLEQIARTRWIVGQRLESNPQVTEVEKRLFEMVESFQVEV